MGEGDVTTTAGDLFTHHMSAQMARLVYVRFGRDAEAAAAAWRRMLQNTTTTAEFEALVSVAEPVSTESPERDEQCDPTCTVWASGDHRCGTM